jgi:hypothetical protein
MDGLLTQEQFDKILKTVEFVKSDPEWSALVPEVQQLLAHIEAQNRILAVAVDSLKALMDGNPSNEQVMAFLKQYAHLIATVPSASPPATPEELDYWKLPKFE